MKQIPGKVRLLARLASRILANPGRFVPYVTLQNLRQLLFALRTQDPETLETGLSEHASFKIPAASRAAEADAPDSGGPVVFPRCGRPLISVIVSVKELNSIKGCLHSVLRNTPEVPCEVFVAAGPGAVKDKIEDDVENVRIIVEGQNWRDACNAAAARAQGDYLLLLSNGVLLRDGCVERLVELARRRQELGLVGPKLLSPEGKLELAGGVIFRDGTLLKYGEGDDPGKPEYNYVKETDFIPGECMLVRKDLWNRIGGFASQFRDDSFIYADFACEVRRHGSKVGYQPGSEAVRLKAALKVGARPAVEQGMEAERRVFLEKWHGEMFCEPSDLFRARDRAAGKTTVLVVDRYVPMADRDAGSKSVHQYLGLLVELGLNVKFLGNDFYPHQPYCGELQQMGIEVLYGPWLQWGWKRWIKENSAFLDFAYLHRPNVAIRYVKFIRRHTRAKIIYNGHDLRFLREARRYELERKRAFLSASRYWEKVEIEIARRADVLHFYSETEASEIKRRVPGAMVRCIPLFLFRPDTLDSGLPAEQRAGLLFVGGFAHEPNVDAVLWFVAQIFPSIRERIPEVRLTVVGEDPPAGIQGFASAEVVIAGHISESALTEHYCRCRIVVAPLRYGAGVKGKIIDAICFQVPAVTTPVGAEGIPEAEAILSIAEDAEDFASRVVDLYLDHGRWNATSRRLADYAAAHFSREAARDIIRQDFEAG